MIVLSTMLLGIFDTNKVLLTKWCTERPLRVWQFDVPGLFEVVLAADVRIRGAVGDPHVRPRYKSHSMLLAVMRDRYTKWD